MSLVVIRDNPEHPILDREKWVIVRGAPERLKVDDHGYAIKTGLFAVSDFGETALVYEMTPHE